MTDEDKQKFIDWCLIYVGVDVMKFPTAKMRREQAWLRIKGMEIMLMTMREHLGIDMPDLPQERVIKLLGLPPAHRSTDDGNP